MRGSRACFAGQSWAWDGVRFFFFICAGASSRCAATILLVLHHGSRTSSTREFIESVSPRWAVVAAGYRNRFGHPHSEVLNRYREAGITLLRTDLDGAVHVVLNGKGARVAGERARKPRYWRRAPSV